MTKCRFDGMIMEESKRLAIVEYRCPECGHYWYRNSKLKTHQTNNT